MIASLIESFVADGTGFISALRTLRVFRVIYDIKELKRLKDFLTKVLIALKELGNLVFIVILTTLIFALLGMQLFGGKMGAGEEKFRSNFDAIFIACITTFQVLTLTWTDVMYAAMNGAGPVAALFFVALIIIGRQMVLSLFIAVLLDSLWRGMLTRAEQKTRRRLKKLSIYKARAQPGLGGLGGPPPGRAALRSQHHPQRLTPTCAPLPALAAPCRRTR